jgi:hypothetical protein
VDRLQRRQETLLRENEKMKNERGNRKFMGSGTSGATPGGYQGKFGASMFG